MEVQPVATYGDEASTTRLTGVNIPTSHTDMVYLRRHCEAEVEPVAMVMKPAPHGLHESCHFRSWYEPIGQSLHVLSVESLYWPGVEQFAVRLYMDKKITSCS